MPVEFNFTPQQRAQMESLFVPKTSPQRYQSMIENHFRLALQSRPSTSMAMQPSNSLTTPGRRHTTTQAAESIPPALSQKRKAPSDSSHGPRTKLAKTTGHQAANLISNVSRTTASPHGNLAVTVAPTTATASDRTEIPKPTVIRGWTQLQQPARDFLAKNPQVSPSNYYRLNPDELQVAANTFVPGAIVDNAHFLDINRDLQHFILDQTPINNGRTPVEKEIILKLLNAYKAAGIKSFGSLKEIRDAFCARNPGYTASARAVASAQHTFSPFSHIPVFPDRISDRRPAPLPTAVSKYR